MQVAIVEDTAPGRDFERALLLLGGTVYVIFVVNDLQPDQTDTDEGDPESKEDRNVQQAQTASNGTRIYRARGGVTPLGRRLSAV
jgi:hypothetical protein